MTEIVTEARYTRAFVYASTMFTSGMVLMFLGSAIIGLSNDPATTIGGCISAGIGLVFMSDCAAALDRGICYRFWKVLDKAPPFTLNDVDADELRDGPIKVNDD